ncbi:MAG: pentapeptide repeat-containing protein [Cyanobacteria bacterium SBLK]|nr:pentapeptide repeat-containing protein [Cyanobacteria bacterium SBLK]
MVLAIALLSCSNAGLADVGLNPKLGQDNNQQATSMFCLFGCQSNSSSSPESRQGSNSKIFSGQDLLGSRFDGANLQGASFHKANLSNTDLSNTNLTRADLSGADLTDVKIGRIKNIDSLDFSDIDWSKIHLAKNESLKFARSNLEKDNILELAQEQLSDRDLLDLLKMKNFDVDITDIGVTKIKLNRKVLLSLINENLNNSSLFHSSTISAQDLLNLLIRQNLLVKVDLTGADLHDTNFSGANLKNAVLNGAKMPNGNIYRP